MLLEDFLWAGHGTYWEVDELQWSKERKKTTAW